MAISARLYFVHMPGCHMCAQVKPLVRQFRDARPDVKVIPVDITAINWNAEKWIPSVTPTLIKLDKKGQYHVFDGVPDGEGRVVELEEVRKWLLSNF